MCSPVASNHSHMPLTPTVLASYPLCTVNEVLLSSVKLKVWNIQYNKVICLSPVPMCECGRFFGLRERCSDSVTDFMLKVSKRFTQNSKPVWLHFVRGKHKEMFCLSCSISYSQIEWGQYNSFMWGTGRNVLIIYSKSSLGFHLLLLYEKSSLNIAQDFSFSDPRIK